MPLSLFTRPSLQYQGFRVIMATSTMQITGVELITIHTPTIHMLRFLQYWNRLTEENLSFGVGLTHEELADVESVLYHTSTPADSIETLMELSLATSVTMQFRNRQVSQITRSVSSHRTLTTKDHTVIGDMESDLPPPLPPQHHPRCSLED
jgi:hypothetical protein